MKAFIYHCRHFHTIGCSNLTKTLKWNAFEGINAESQVIAYALIETGCRPSEVANLSPKNICLDAETLHIRIRPTAKRELEFVTFYMTTDTQDITYSWKLDNEECQNQYPLRILENSHNGVFIGKLLTILI